MEEDTRYLYVLEEYTSVGELLPFLAKKFPGGEFFYLDRKSPPTSPPKRVSLSSGGKRIGEISSELEGVKLGDVSVVLNDSVGGEIYFGDFDPDFGLGPFSGSILKREVLTFEVLFRGVHPPANLRGDLLEEITSNWRADHAYDKRFAEVRSCLWVARSVFSAVKSASLCLVAREYESFELYIYIKGAGDVSLNRRNVPSVLMLELEDLEDLTRVYLESRSAGERSPFHLYDCIGDCFSCEPNQVMIEALEQMNSIAKDLDLNSEDILIEDIRYSINDFRKLIEDDMPDSWRSYLRSV